MKYLLTLLFFSSLFCRGAEFQVDGRQGLPVIRKDGVPVSARMVYVSKTAQEIATVRPQWSDFTLRFSILKSCDNAALHLRFFSLAFQRKPEEIRFSRIEVRDVTTGRTVKRYRFDGEKIDPDISFWCTGKWKNGKKMPIPATISNHPAPGIPGGTLRIASPGDPSGKLGEFHLILYGIPVEKNRDYVVLCRARADREQNLTSSLYHQTAVPQALTYPGTTLRTQVKLAAESGIHFVTFPIDNLWPDADGNSDYSVLDRICRIILKENPKAQLIPRIDLRTPPEWWQKRYPGEMMKFTSGGNGGYPSISSLRYRRDAAEVLRGAIRYCEKNFPDNMAGYHPTGGNTHEWFYYRSQRRILSGYDEATRRVWRKYLTEKYKTADALQRAWQQPDISPENAEIPAPAYRQKERQNSLLSPRQDAPLIDFHLFLQKEMADTVLTMARTVREETGKRRLCILFYGYLSEFSAIANSPACSGHYALRRVLASPDVDLLAGPISYLDRQLGGGSTTMTAADSILLAGKLWLNEDDTSTHTAYRNGNRAPGWKNGAMTLTESLFLLRRNLAFATFHGFGIWWMDLFGAGWFSDPELWKLMRETDSLDAEMRDQQIPIVPQVAEIVDETSLLYLSPAGFRRNYNSAVSYPLIKNGRAARARTGASTGQYLLDDLLAGKVRSELNIITSAWALTGQQRRQLRATAENTPTFWCWAPGWLDLSTGQFSTGTVEQTTGFQVRQLENESFAIRPTPAGIQFGLAPAGSGKMEETGNPVLSPVPQEGDLVLAEYRSGAPAILLRPGRVPALFCGTTAVPPELYRAFAAYAGVHLYTDRPAYVQRRGNYLSICAPEDGLYEINPGENCKTVDLQNGKTVGTNSKFHLSLKKGECRILKRIEIRP